MPQPLSHRASTGRSRAPSAETEQIVLDSAEAAAALDAGLRVVAWNREAEKLLGHSRSSIRGKPVHDVLKTRDLFGNPVSCFCGAWQAMRQGESVRRFVVEVTTGRGDRLRVVVQLEAAPAGEPASALVCRFRPDQRRFQIDRRGTAPAHRGSNDGSSHSARELRSPSLSPAELSVLRLLCMGKRADEIASTLGNSVLTIRNHIRHILKKLGARNQAQAVSTAIRTGLV